MIIMVQTARDLAFLSRAPGETPDVDRDFNRAWRRQRARGPVRGFSGERQPSAHGHRRRTGGRSQIAGLVACVVIVATSLYGADLLAKVPTTALAGVLLFVAGRIFRVGEMRDIGGKTKAESH